METKLEVLVLPVFDVDRRVSGPAPDRSDYGSFVAFYVPDGNGWFIQEVRQRTPGR